MVRDREHLKEEKSNRRRQVAADNGVTGRLMKAQQLDNIGN